MDSASKAPFHNQSNYRAVLHPEDACHGGLQIPCDAVLVISPWFLYSSSIEEALKTDPRLRTGTVTDRRSVQVQCGTENPSPTP